jgi:putative transposase
MSRLARVIAIDTPHHITQRGNARRSVLECDADRAVYLQLLSHYCRLYGLSLAGYCLMSNHVHLVAIPRRLESQALVLKHTHGRYAAYFNARNLSSGHVWQGRYYSCPLDERHFWAALRYVERNPIRAGLASAPEDYFWSSAKAHCMEGHRDILVDLELWQRSWTVAGWREYIASGEEEEETAEIRRSTHTGRPMGTPEFVQSLERALRRPLTPGRGGRPAKQKMDVRQQSFGFERG